MKVKDLMEPVSAYLSPDETVVEAVRKMRISKRRHGLGYKGMMVLDSRGELVGIVSMKDILRATLPKYLSRQLSAFTWEGMLEERASKVADKKVRDIMSTNIIYLHEDDSLMECVDLLIENNLQRLPVKNRDGKVTGIIFLRDIYIFVTKIFGEGTNCPV